MNDIVVRTIIPILLLIGTGLLSRRTGISKSGDERVLSAYVYYFALPASFFINMVETNFVEEIEFMLAGVLPVFVALFIHITLYLTIGFSKNTLYLLILSTIFGSFALFGIPFVPFAFPEQGEHLATLSAASIATVIVTLSFAVLELYKLEEPTIREGLKRVAKKLSKNPLIVSILSGALLSVLGVGFPTPISSFLHMLRSTTSTVAVFMLGFFLYGRKYANMVAAFKLSLLRIVLLPVVAFLTTMLFRLPDVERSTLVLTHGMPVAISMMVLSERYDFYRGTIASLILISSLGAGLYLNLWLLLLGYF